MERLEKIAWGTFVNSDTKRIVPSPDELTSKTFQGTLGYAESEEIAAAFAYTSKEHGQWVGMSYDRLYEQVCKHIVLTFARAAEKDGTELPPEIKKDLESKNYYPAFVLAYKMRQDPKTLLTEVSSICEAATYRREPVFILNHGVINRIYEAQQEKGC